MVESIGIKGVTTQERVVVPVTPAPQAASVANAAAKPSETASKQLELTALAFEFGTSSPIDEKRVEEVKRAVRNGTYPILPETIADRMLALKLNWSPKK